jgi:hypothetical protein
MSRFKLNASGQPAKSTCTESSTTRSTGTSGSMTFGSRFHLRYRRTHSRKIYKQRHSGEILQDNPRHDERNLLLNRIFGIPIRQPLNVYLRNLFPVTVSKHGPEYVRILTGSLEIVPTPASSSTGSE